MKISYGNSRFETKWKNGEISWEDFKKRVSSTIRTTETIEEYRKMTKAQQANVKDKGGFVAGHLKGGRRKKNTVLCRSALALDMDYGTPGVWDDVIAKQPYRCCAYSTRSISENEKWSVKKRFEQGIPTARPRILGYRWEGDTMVVIAEEAEIVKRIYQNFLDGKSRLETERELAAEGITSVNRKRMCDSQLKNILTNISYTGNLLLQKEYVEDPISKKRKKNCGELPQYFVENSHEAIISMETWQFVQDEMARRRELGCFANKSLTLNCFSAKIKCGKCGRSFVRSTRTNRAKISQLGEHYIFWGCTSKKKTNCPSCKNGTIRETVLMEECAKVLGIPEFDEEIFSEKVAQITVPETGTLIFDFTDGTQLTHHWSRNSKKESWTDECRKRASDYRREHAVTRDDITCFTTKIKCEHCGCNFRKQVNEKYKGDALLQKTYTVDYLTKKTKINEGEIPQYYVEGDHEAIIDPAVFDRVQIELEKRCSGKNRHSGVHDFSGKIKCGECGSWYGSKVWHSTDKYRKVIWRCNHKYGGEKCSTPHLTDDEIKAAFISAANKALADKDTVIETFRLIRDSVFDTSALEQERTELTDELNIVAGLIQDGIYQNAHVAQNQADYNRQYETLSARYEKAKSRLDELEERKDAVTEYDVRLWHGMVEFVAVYSKDDIRFTMKDGTEIKA